MSLIYLKAPLSIAVSKKFFMHSNYVIALKGINGIKEEFDLPFTQTEFIRKKLTLLPPEVANY